MSREWPFMRRERGAGAAGVYRRPRSWARRAAACLTILALGSCKNFNVFTIQDDAELGQQAYAQILGGAAGGAQAAAPQEDQGEKSGSAPLKLVKSGPSYQMVNRAMERLVAAAREEEPEIVDAFTWEVSLIADDATVNAFALPGGKMAVYTGILPVAESETGLAVVMGHEIGHVIERHGTEAMTKQMTAAVLLDILVQGDERQIAEVANSLVQLKFGRSAELEADRRGLMYMARAGYDPREAVHFWERMTSLGGGSPPEWLSTHPSHDTRIQQLQDLLSEAIPVYEASQKPKP